VSQAPRRWVLAAGLAAVATVLVIVAVLVGTGPAPSDGIPPSADVSPHDAIPVRVSDSGASRHIPAGYLGLSIEFPAVRDYTGSNPHRVNPVLLQLIRNLSPGQAPVLRIGGDSTDMSWVPAPGVKAPPYRTYRLTPGWLWTTAALARDLGAHMILGINLAANQVALARAEAQAYVRTMGRNRISALEIGNEPNLYGKIASLKVATDRVRRARPRSYDYAGFSREFAAMAGVLPAIPLAGPALAVGPTYDPGTWIGSVPGLLRSLPQLRTLTIHRYPLRNCNVPPSSPQYPTVPHLLSSYATTTLAASLRSWVTIAHSAHRPLRVDELNSAACRGKAGVSDTFASSLWVTDALFTLARAGVDGVNMHTLPGSAYELFHFTHAGTGWSAYVRPVYYGLQLFAQAAPAGARLLTTSGPMAGTGLSVWATRTADGVERVVLINESPTRSRTVSLQMPAGAVPTAQVIRLQAARVDARTGVTWGGRSYGSATTSGHLPAPQTQTLTSRAARYTLSVRHGSAALVTFPVGIAPY
jgi:Glycosyl hydrolase family 79 C-terminal beta domain